ncbi:MAG TPA: Rv2993c-like domain-containing protein [Dehalococcoidia bacterium]|jgi:2-keto-4-pentenoate hydratase/2-oxohepta-3-ene-1,7-dioic acid hydratase in catechol pathway
MLYCRFQHEGVISHGVVGGDRVTPIAGDLFGAHKSGRRRLPLSEVRLLAPIVPRKILAAAVNYQSHIPSGSTVLKDDGAPAIPQLFLKPSSSIIGPRRRLSCQPRRAAWTPRGKSSP